MTDINQNQITNNYENPLDHFRSYSYQFIMTLASTTQAFANMMGTGGQGAPLFDLVNKAKSPGDEIDVGGGQKAYLVLDTRRFSQYAITDLSMEHIYGTGTAQNPSVPANTTHMKLIDTTGMSFFNLLLDLFRNKIQSTRASSFFLLTVLFVGHKDDGTTEVVSTCFIPLMLLTMGFSLDFRGSEYEIDFMEMEGAPKPGAPMEHLNYMGSIQSITSKDQDNTIEGMIAALEKQLNVQSLDFYQKYTNDALQKSGNSTKDNNKKFGKLVQYMITVPEEWRKYKCTLAGRSKNVEQMFIAAKKDAVNTQEVKQQVDLVKLETDKAYAQMSFAPTTTVTDAVKGILECSLDLLKEASEEKRKAGQARAYKTIMTVTSDETTYVIHIDIFPYNLPKLETEKKDGGQTNTSTAQPGGSNVIGDASKIHNLMTYNYIFTGKNSHIMNLEIKYLPESAVALDMNLDIGRSRFATNAAAGQKKSGVQASADGEKKTTSFSPDIRGSDPIFIPLKSQDQQNNTININTEQVSKDQSVAAFKAKQEFTQTYAYMHFLSSISLDMTIRGNPNLIKKYADRNARGGIPPHKQIISADEAQTLTKSKNSAEDNYNKILAKAISSSKAEYYNAYVAPRIKGPSTSNGQHDPLLDGPDVSVEPVFCKINMLAPNVDFNGNYVQGESMFTDKFFFNGPYMVLFVQTSFSNGEFSHTLSMIPYDVSGIVTQNDISSTAPAKAG